MNNAKMWLVVKPTVGIPLFLTAVAVGSFAVHVAVLSNTTWVSDFLKGKPIAGGTAALEMPATVAPAQAAFVTPGAQEVLVLMPDGTTARAILQPPANMAALQ